MIPARVTHLEPFGAFVDAGCGVPSLIGIENLSVSRICHPGDRLTVGQSILAAVRTVEPENRRISLTHRELLGTWAQNAALFSVGETVRGVVRSIEPYGVFIELTPNLSGLAEPRADLRPGMAVSVYIKSILPQRMKVKLTVIDVLAPYDAPKGISTSGSIHRRAAIKKLLKLYLDNPYRRARRLGAPFVTVCRRFMRRAEVVLQRTISCPAGQFTLSRPTKNVPKAINANEKNGEWKIYTFILHFQFSIISSP